MNFNDFPFSPKLRQGVTDAGYETPTPIQQEAIPLILEGRDVIGLAQTGTGKTAAFALPLLEKLLSAGQLPRHISVLVLAPTRELATQLAECFTDLGKHTGIRTLALFGGIKVSRHIRELKSRPHVIVACPGRLLDLMEQREIDLSHVHTLVLDEADHMCDMGFLPMVRRIVRALPRDRQNLLFSATMPSDIRGLADQLVVDPATVKVGTSLAPTKTVSHAMYPVRNDQKTLLLERVLADTKCESAIVFTRTKFRAKKLAVVLNKKGFSATSLQGNLSQNKRVQAISGFKDGTFQIMVATDIAARGIDIAQVGHVINFDVPNTTEAYTHRIGRTGRAARSGKAYTFITSEDAHFVRRVERLLGHQVPKERFDDFDYKAESKTDPENALERPPRGQGNGGGGYSSRRPGGGNGPRGGGGRGRGGPSGGGGGHRRGGQSSSSSGGGNRGPRRGSGNSSSASSRTSTTSSSHHQR